LRAGRTAAWPGNTVTRLDRLARSTIDLLTTIKQIADKECLFKSLADPW
jgi:DNA invertase Pin-like site-specific DNA recombinase